MLSIKRTTIITTTIINTAITVTTMTTIPKMLSQCSVVL